MPRHLLRTLGPMLGLLLMAGTAPAMAASQPTLFTLSAGTPKILAQGAQKSWPVKISEDQAFDAVFQGGMWLPNPSGGRIYAKYQRHILHNNGTWTWIGTVSTVHGDQSVVLTFGKDGVFGLVPQASGYPLRIMSNAAGTRVVETSATAMAQSAEALRMHSAPDYVIPPKVVNRKGGNPSGLTMSVEASAPVPVRAAASGPVIIDVMVAYTPGFVTELGSQAKALTRIQNLVDLTNQAYVNSGVNQQIRLVNTVEVNYPDNTSNDSALDDLTGLDTNGNPVPVPASLQGIAALRVQYGADLVSLIRSYDNATQGNCGIGWLIGGNQTPIVPSQSKAYGYSVVSDGSNGGYYCLDTTFAHELGHNMGDAHDRANANESGAYSYSYGYVNHLANGFSTIMAYGSATDTPLSLFSNPDISTCQNTPCGVADSASNSADNAHSMNNTAALIAQFEPTMVGSPTPAGHYVHNDVNGDGMSDLIWRAKDNTRFAYWIMNGTQLGSTLAMPVSANYKMVATGDFDGDGKMDIIWTDGTSMWMWVGNGNSFTSTYMRPYPAGWTAVGAEDLDGDGKTDLIWVTSGRIAEWLMNGTSFSATYAQNLSSGWRYLASGDFDGDGKADLLLTNGSAMQMWTNFNAGTFTQVATHTYPVGWTILGTGDVNGDGKDDLLWRDNAHTRFAYWIMNGPQLGDSKAINVSAQWHFGTAGDFAGNGLLGLVWYNNSQIVLWPGSSTGNYQGVVVHSYPSAWTLLP
ncbi:MAG TPA: FG-GAP-like repeat-containing protein [Rhodanobacteraceae bacterium]|nr:FG-GAP-like repeat-containing protein [Rhodanobacteraceae bacterium]